jgi:PKD domain/Glycosyl hydrolase family 26
VRAWCATAAAAALCGSAIVVAAPGVAGSTATALAVPSTGTLFGAFANPKNGGGQNGTSFSALETQAGRQLDVDRVYSTWSTAEPSFQASWDVAHAIIPLVSVDPTTAAGPVPWAQIAAGDDDAAIAAQAQGLASLRSPVLLAFDHEANILVGYGTAAEYVAAYQHYVTVVRQYAPNVSFVLILTAAGYGSSLITQWYPGDAYVDWVGADGYNRDGCGSGTSSAWQDFSTIFSNFDSFAVAHGKPAVVAEWGSEEDPNQADHKAAWITAAGQTMEGWPQIKAASYFDATGDIAGCDFSLTTSASAAQAFAQLGQQAYFNVRPTVAVSPSPEAGQAPLEVGFDTAGTAGTMNPIASWVMNFGDGTTTSGSGAPPSSIDHTFAAGEYAATLSVTDSAGQTNFANTTVQTERPSVAGPAGQSTSTTAATVHGLINPRGLDTTYQFSWGTTPAFGASSTATDIGAGTANVQVSDNLSGLTPGTTYYWQLSAVSAAGTSLSPLMKLRTRGGAPQVSSVTATLDSPASATLAADVNPEDVDTTWYFEYGTTASYGSTSPGAPADIGSGTTSVAVSSELDGLPAGSTYYYALVATNAAGTTISPNHSLRTPDPPTLAGVTSSQTSTTAQLLAGIDPHGLATTYRFQWGTSSGSLSSATGWSSAGSGTTGVRETVSLSGLQPDTTYYWDVTATNAAGSVTCTTATFTTK